MNDWTGNSKSVHVTLGANNHSEKERVDKDFYATDPKAVKYLLEKEFFSNSILEPCVGAGHIAEVLKDNGYNVMVMDIVDRGYPYTIVQDFLEYNEKFGGDIITNPPYKCFDIDTQCYTKRGWLKYNELNYTDEILSVNPSTQELEWSKIKNIIIREKQPEEKMYHFKTSNMDIMVTEGHRMFVFSKSTNKLLKCNEDLIKSEDIRSTHYFPRCGYSWKGEEVNTFVLPSIYGHEYAQPVIKDEIKIDMDCWLKFFGLWLADGYCRHTKNSQGNYRKTIGIKQLAIRKQEVEKILDALPFKYIEREDNYNHKNPCINFIINNEQLWEYLIKFGYSEDKFIPFELKNLSSRQLKILLDSYFFGDGSEYLSNGKLFRTISKQLSNDVWEILLKLGYLSHINNTTYTTSEGYEHRMYSITYNPDSVYNRVTFKSNKNDACLCDYSGKVWCVELEKNGVFILRRNRHEFVCGNCAVDFVKKSIEVIENGHKVAMFLKIQFLEGKKRREFFKEYPPKYVYVFSGRVNCFRNGDMTNKDSSAVCYCWYIWEKGYKGEPIVRWIDN